MQAFLISIATVAIAEMGDRTQLLALLLTARFRQPWPILFGILAATLANHALAGALGAWLGRFLTPFLLDCTVGVSLVTMGLWMLKPDSPTSAPIDNSARGVFATTVIAFFLAEIGDKTQFTTMALAAAYPNLPAVIAGTTAGMLAANAPVVVLGNAFASRLPFRAINVGAASLFMLLGLSFLARAVWSVPPS